MSDGKSSSGALLSPNPMYTPVSDMELIQCVTSRVDDIIELSPVGRSASCRQNWLAQWCEVEVITLPDIHQRTSLSLNFLRMFLRHDITFSGEEAGDVYRINFERGVLKSDTLESADFRTVLMYLPKDSSEGAVALQTFARNPCLPEPQLPDGDDLDELFSDIAFGIRYAKQINNDFYSWHGLTNFDVDKIYEELELIYDSFRLGSASGNSTNN